jgi:hypothetical protein
LWLQLGKGPIRVWICMRKPWNRPVAPICTTVRVACCFPLLRIGEVPKPARPYRGFRLAGGQARQRAPQLNEGLIASSHTGSRCVPPLGDSRIHQLTAESRPVAWLTMGFQKASSIAKFMSVRKHVPKLLCPKRTLPNSSNSRLLRSDWQRQICISPVSESRDVSQ